MNVETPFDLGVRATLFYRQSQHATCLLKIDGAIPVDDQDILTKFVRAIVINQRLDVHVLTVVLNGEIVDFRPHPNDFISEAVPSGIQLAR